MKPGTYTMVYYQGEYAVAKSSVTVTAGSTKSKSISGSVKTGTTIFKIGEWDGQYEHPLYPSLTLVASKIQRPVELIPNLQHSQQTNRLPQRCLPTPHAPLRRPHVLLDLLIRDNLHRGKLINLLLPNGPLQIRQFTPHDQIHRNICANGRRDAANRHDAFVRWRTAPGHS